MHLLLWTHTNTGINAINITCIIQISYQFKSIAILLYVWDTLNDRVLSSFSLTSFIRDSLQNFFRIMFISNRLVTKFCKSWFFWTSSRLKHYIHRREFYCFTDSSGARTMNLNLSVSNPHIDIIVWSHLETVLFETESWGSLWGSLYDTISVRSYPNIFWPTYILP